MKVLVTGGAGFIGSNLVRFLLNEHPDYRVINADKLGVGSNVQSLDDLKSDKKYKFIKSDTSDPKFAGRVIKDVEAVFNLAAESHVDRSIANPFLFLQSNTIGTFNLLEAMRKSNEDAKFVQVSTDEVYGEIDAGSFDENVLLKPSSAYAASKAAADLFCLAHFKTYGLKIVITRCTNNFGPYQFPEKLVPKTVARASMNLQVPIYGSGKNVRDWIYVLDHCKALDIVLQKGKVGEIYNISSGNELENIEIVKKILRIMNKPEKLITFVEDRPGHDIRYSLDSSKVRGELGWKPKYRFDEALRSTVEWYLENKWWWESLATDEVIHPTPWNLKW